MKVIKQEINQRNGGYCCHFEHNGNYYWADVAKVHYIGPECMIFKADSNGEVKNRCKEYVNRNVNISGNGLMKCIEEFCKELDEQNK